MPTRESTSHSKGKPRSDDFHPLDTLARRQESGLEEADTTTVDLISPQQPPPPPSRAKTHQRISSTTIPQSPEALQDSSDTPKSSSYSSSPTAAITSPSHASVNADCYFAVLPTESGREVRSPPNKRPPASRSGKGIDTSAGPPPAWSTLRSAQAFEKAWRPALPEDFSLFQKLGPHALSNLNVPDNARPTVIKHDRQDGADRIAHQYGRTETTGLQDIIAGSNMIATLTQTRAGSTMERRMNGNDARRILTTESDRDPGRQSQSSEDLFLNLARTNDDTSEAGELMRRKSTNGTGHHPSLSQPAARPLNPRPASREQNMTYVTARRSSLNQAQWASLTATTSPGDRPRNGERQYSRTTHPLDERYRQRVSGPKLTLTPTQDHSSWETTPESNLLSPRRQSLTESTQSPRVYRNSKLAHSNSGYYHSSSITGHHEYSDGHESSLPTESTESTVSTTAPSTVWDELDDLKSRIRKLELTGKLPLSSAAAVSGAMGERPRTATTTNTTMSMSPKRPSVQSISPVTSLGFEDASLHPLLNAALAKTMPHLPSNVYHALETTASDALMLAKMASGTSQTGSVPSVLERQLKRKADNMCRNLTELCITLCSSVPENFLSEPEQQRNRPGSRDTTLARQQREESLGLDDLRFHSRTDNVEPETSSASARVFSRLEARRSSMLFASGHPSSSKVSTGASPAQNSQSNTVTPTQLAPSTPAAAALARTSTVLQRARDARSPSVEKLDSKDEDLTERPIRSRPLSRAVVEAGRATGPIERSSALRANHAVREHTSQRLMPATEDDRSSKVRATSPLPARRNFLSKETPATPITPAFRSGRRYLDRTQPTEKRERLSTVGIGRRREDREGR